MKLYIARDKDNSLSLCSHKQIYDEFFDSWQEPKEFFDDKHAFYTYILEKLFPEVTFENSPQEVELKLVEKFNPIIKQGQIDKRIIDRAYEYLKSKIDVDVAKKSN